MGRNKSKKKKNCLMFKKGLQVKVMDVSKGFGGVI
jgi:transcription antitermination factor NusG